MVKPDGEIDTFLLSCRILGKGIEIAFVKTIISLLAKEDFMHLTASYLPTAKNIQVKEFWEKTGFSCTKENEDGSKYYSLEIQGTDVEIKKYYHITIK